MRPRCGKKPFLSRSVALLELSRANEMKHDGIGRRKESRAYRCDVCSFWHLTSKRGRKESAA